MCRRLSIFLLALLVASFSLWAFPGRVTGFSEEEPIVTIEEPIAEELPLSKPSGIESETTSKGLAKSLEKLQTEKRIDGEDLEELKMTLSQVQDDIEILHTASVAKDEEIHNLKADLADAEEAKGTKGYLIVSGIMGFDDVMLPEFGVGLTIGTRIGDHLMVQLGADYMIGGIAGYEPFGLENLEIEAGVGWMF